MLFHAGFTTFGGSVAGVDVFFVIGGFLITPIIISDKEAGTFSIVGFYERRVRRILPALFLVLLASLAPAWIWLPQSATVGFCKSLLGVSLLGSNDEGSIMLQKKNTVSITRFRRLLVKPPATLSEKRW